MCSPEFHVFVCRCLPGSFHDKTYRPNNNFAGFDLNLTANGDHAYPYNATCTGCPIGSYIGSVGSTACTVCPAGKFASTTGSSVCANCPAGSWTNATGSTATADCTRCIAGKYKSISGQIADTCEMCPTGKWSLPGKKKDQDVQVLPLSHCLSSFFVGINFYLPTFGLSVCLSVCNELARTFSYAPPHFLSRCFSQCQSKIREP